VGLLLGAVGYSLVKDEPKPPSPAAQGKPQANAPPAPTAQLPEPFREATGRGTPGEAVAWYLDKGTPEAGIDAYRLIYSCMRSQVQAACDGVTSEMERKAPELLVQGMLNKVPGAAALYFHFISMATPEELTPEQAQAARAAGVQLARECNCKEG
jgi:hypothetical protein